MSFRDHGPPAETAADFDYEAAILACAAGDQLAFRRLYEVEASRLLATALRIVRRPDLAHDIVHDAFVTVWNRAASFDPA